MNPQNITIVIGCLLVIAGVAAIYWPAALVVAGIFAIAGAFTSEF